MPASVKEMNCGPGIILYESPSVALGTLFRLGFPDLTDTEIHSGAVRLVRNKTDSNGFQRHDLEIPLSACCHLTFAR